jgi:DNA-binding MarR family transcriptional regulator
MQPLPATSIDASARECAAAILDSAPGLVWYVRRHMRRHRKGLSVPQFRALFKVHKQPDASLSCVAEHLGASLPTTSRIVANLVSKGFLARGQSNDDRRQIILALTPRGRAILDSARKASLQRIEAEFSRVDGQDRAAICRALEILSHFVSGVQQSGSAPLSGAGAKAVRPRRQARAA